MAKLSIDQIKTVLSMLEGQSFADWYEGSFMDHVTGDTELSLDDSKDKVLGELERLLERG